MDSVLVAGASTAKDQHTNMLTPSDAVQQQHSTPVSYTHLTLPTSDLV